MTVSWSRFRGAVHYSSIETYYWKPQLVGLRTVVGDDEEKTGRFQRAQAKHRAAEETLNGLLNLLLSVAGPPVCTSVLEAFGFSRMVHVECEASPIAFNRWITNTENVCQPDLAFDAGPVRVFLEMKVGHSFTVQQIHKYLAAFVRWSQESDASTSANLLCLLAPKALPQQWEASERGAIFHGGDPVQELVAFVKQQPFPDTLGSWPCTDQVRAGIPDAIEKLIVGVATWQQIGDRLESCRREYVGRGDHPACAPADRLFSGFLAELSRRNLWAPAQRERASSPDL